MGEFCFEGKVSGTVVNDGLVGLNVPLIVHHQLCLTHEQFIAAD
jgi:hypothetical protein